MISFRLDDPGIAAGEKELAFEEARRYFHLAHHYALRLNRPIFLITCGLMGTGKSTIARALSEALGWEWLRSDVLRKELADLSPREHRFEKFHEGIYSPDFSREIYRALLDRASALLKEGKSVILDASFKKQADRLQALALAEARQANFLLIECRCSEEEIQRRLARRSILKRDPSDGRWELFREQKEDFERVEMDPSLHFPLNTQSTPQRSLGSIFQHLLRRAGRDLQKSGVIIIEKGDPAGGPAES